ncbi:hypothetical protein F3Y22_tig00111330pilonHSYRG00629 [Hibiscus syriacus]|uniref:Sieve element occlusion N-terminal domain-containing protein n=1 Tax=Hibiscus syriacus TaxID=106335 RepID=A0A6A2YPZ5_HIBSY|nr:hypothetical protein F3Y22_tig00111330pilonHSYRG00629 [Hibiscus syriacus]
MFAVSDDSAMIKQIQSTHAPDGRLVNVNPILHIIDNILRHITPNIDHALNIRPVYPLMTTCLMHWLTSYRKSPARRSRCSCNNNGDSQHALKLFMGCESGASFSCFRSELRGVLASCPTLHHQFTGQIRGSLQSIARRFRAFPNNETHFEALNKSIKAMIDVTKCIVEFTMLPTKYISSEVPPTSIALAHIPTTTYRTVRSVVACAAFVTSNSEAWELSSLAHKVSNIHEHLQILLRRCYHRIDEMKQKEAFDDFKLTIETPQVDVVRILIRIFHKEDPHALLSPEKTKVIKTRVDELALLGKPIDDEDLIDRVLEGLSDEYKSVIDAINACDTPISFAELHEKLLNKEASLQTAQPPSLSLPAMTNPTAFQNRLNWRPSATNSQQSCPTTILSPHDQCQLKPYLGRCQSCDTQGHTANRCPIGASHHVTSDLSNLSLHSSYQGSDDVMIGDGSTLHITHTGSTTIPTSSRTFTLQNVKDLNTGTILLMGEPKDGVYEWLTTSPLVSSPPLLAFSSVKTTSFE